MDDDYPEFPWIGGIGSTHDLRDADRPEPRLWNMRSVSRAAALALHNQTDRKPRHIGFRIPPVR